MQKTKKIIIFILLLVIITIPKISIADVGSFESYDSGSDWGESSYSSWDYDYDDDWDDDWSGSSSRRGSPAGNLGGIIGTIVFFSIILYCLYISHGKNRNIQRRPLHRVQNTVVSEPIINESIIELKIKETDELFNKEEFNQKAKMLFVKMQNAWMDRNWEEIRAFETDELFEQHQSQIEGYIRNKQINVMDRICVLYSKLYRFEQKGDKEVLEIILKSRMADYIIDEDTKQIIKGDKNIERIRLYRLQFIRKLGVKTKPESTGLNTTNCPNCGAPTKVTSTGKCDYCGSIITNGEFGWVLNNLEPFQN